MNDNEKSIEFGLFDGTSDTFITERNLPHWFQSGAATFITFRTADSLPQSVCLKLEKELAVWLTDRDLPPTLAEIKIQPQAIKALRESLSELNRREYNKIRYRLINLGLDECHGECLLRQPDIAEMVATAILHQNGIHYDIDRFVIMPNHVHVLGQFREGAPKNIIGQSWMRYSARQINAKLGRSGCLWEAEPFDHIVRSADQFSYLRYYVDQNPIKAKLNATDFYRWPQV